MPHDESLWVDPDFDERYDPESVTVRGRTGSDHDFVHIERLGKATGELVGADSVILVGLVLDREHGQELQLALVDTEEGTLANAVRLAPTEAADYPVRLRVEYPEQSSRLLALLRWLLIIPHIFIVDALWDLLWLVVLIAGVILLFTGRFNLDLFLFDSQGVIVRRVTIDLAPLLDGKTRVAQFHLHSGACAEVSRILVNDIPQCRAETGEPVNCLAGLAVSSRSAIALTK